MSPVNELPVKGSQFFMRGPAALNRRQALSLLASGIASGLAGCSKPAEEIIPYVKIPERVVPGEALKFATTLPLSGFGRGVIVTSIDGRPIKVEGNPRHPASLGATDVFAEATVLSLYDPDRSRTILKNGEIASPEAFRQALQAQLQQMQQRNGGGFRLLTGRVPPRHCCDRSTICYNNFRKPHGTPTSRSARTTRKPVRRWRLEGRCDPCRDSTRRACWWPSTLTRWVRVRTN